MTNFDFTIGKTDIAIINLTSNGLSFNKHSIELLGSAEHVTIGLDRENKRLAIKAIPNNDKTLTVYPFVTDEKKKKRVTVSVSKIRAEIIKLIDVKVCRNGIKLLAEFDTSTQMLIADLTKIIEN